MQTLKAAGLAGALVTSALVGGTLISAVAATPGSGNATTSSTLTDAETAGEYCDLWRETFASELGVDVEALTPAAKSATIAVIEALVADGELPADVGERITAQIEAFDGDGCRLLGAHLHFLGRHGLVSDARHDLLDAAASALGMEPVALIEALRDGDSLQDVAAAQGVDYDAVVKAITDAFAADLAAAVEAGRITQERADAMLANLTEALESGDWPPFGDRRPGAHRGWGLWPGGSDSDSQSETDQSST